jgi:hypothetical protein
MLPKTLFIVWAEVDPAVEEEWNRWYDAVHFPHALSCPGVRSGRRYVSASPITDTIAGEGKAIDSRIYTTEYELESPQTVNTPEFKAMRGWYEFAPHVRSRSVVVNARDDG